MSQNHEEELSFFVSIPGALLENENLEPSCIILYAHLSGLSRKHGYCYATNAYLASRMKCDESTIRRLLASLKGEGFIEIETNKNGIHWQRHISLAVNLKKCLRRGKNEHPPAQNRAPPRLNSSTISNSNINIEIEEKMSEVQAPSDATPSPQTSQESKDVSSDLFSRIKAIHPKHKEPDWVSWQRTLDLIHRRDGRTWEEIKSMIAWVFDHDFWYKQIQSPAALRKHWDKMALQRSTANNKGTQANKNRDTAASIKNYLHSINRGNEIWIDRDCVRNKTNGDAIKYDMNSSEFDNILCKWFKVRLE